jgi:hypothetical protein
LSWRVVLVFVDLCISGADQTGKRPAVTVRNYPQGYEPLDGQQHDHDGQDLAEVRHLLPSGLGLTSLRDYTRDTCALL